MGQTSSHRQTTHSSSHNNNNKDESNAASSQFGNRRSSTRKSKSSKHYSTLVQPLGKDEISILRDSLLRNGSIMRKNMGDPPLRPVTISELKPQTTKLQTTIASIGENGGGAPGDVGVDVESASVCGIGSSSTNNLMSFQLPVDRSAKTEDLAAESSVAAAATVAPAVGQKEKRNEFYIVGDGYHRTDHCYYRGPNGDFHKLPSDSFHKMSEGCFVRMADGVFRRLEMPTKSQISRRSSRADDMNGGGTEGSGNAATNVKSQLMKFLKRSKSHTPATIAKLQKDKEEARLERKQRLSNAMRHQKAMALANTPATAATTTAMTGGKQGNQSSTTGGTGPSIRNNKIVVTMIENGGLPIVATSKAERPKPPTSSAGSEKARTSRVCIKIQVGGQIGGLKKF